MMSEPSVKIDAIYWSMDGWKDRIPYQSNSCYQDGRNMIIELIAQDAPSDLSYIVFSVDAFQDFLNALNQFSASPSTISLNTISSFRFIASPEGYIATYYRVKPVQFVVIKGRLRFIFLIEGVEIPKDQFEREMAESRSRLSDPQSTESIWLDRFKTIEAKEIEKLTSIGSMFDPNKFEIYSFDAEGNFHYDEDRCLKRLNGFDENFTDGEYILKRYSKYVQSQMYLDFSREMLTSCLQQWSAIPIQKKEAIIDWHQRDNFNNGDVDPNLGIEFHPSRA